MNKSQRYHARLRGLPVPKLAGNNGGGWWRRAQCEIYQRTGRLCTTCKRRWRIKEALTKAEAS